MTDLKTAEKRGLTEIHLSEKAEEIGSASELTPLHRARLGLARYILSGIFLTFLLSLFVMVIVPEERLPIAQAMFDFIKTIGPPIVTLVIGFYFRGETSD